MSIASHLEELRRKHRTLAERIEHEERSPASDATQLRDLKREKLRLKDEISRMMANA